MTTRTYYLPKSRISLHILNVLVAKVGCSLGEIKQLKETIKVPITCNEADVKKIELVLSTYGMVEE